MSKNERLEKNPHGRFARTPEEIPPRGWFDVAKRVYRQIGEDNIGIAAAGVAFYAFLAIFPTIAATIALYGLIIDPQTVQQQMNEISNILPQQSAQLLQDQLGQIARSSPAALSWGLVFSILLSLWSANKGTRALFQAINIAYNEEDRRGFLKGNVITILFTLLEIVVVIISMALVIALPALTGQLGFSGVLQTIVLIVRWLLLAAVIIATLAILYRFAPDRENPQWKWVSWGSVIATMLWLTGSWGFSYYVRNFGNFNATYGSLAAVVILLLWFNLSSFIVLFGAEINSELERQTMRDTTTGKSLPMGKRGASDADNLGKAA
jgi:membrane protein